MGAEYAEEDDFAEKDSVLRDISYWLEQVLGTYIVNSALEIGGSGGVLGGLFAERHGNTICTDIVDWDFKHGGEGIKLLKEKFVRNGRKLPVDRFKYIPVDAQNLIFRDNLFDVVYSLNAFEHIPDPGKALREAIRVTRPGGMIYLRFDPVWTADSGSHFLHRIGAPWAHLILNDNEIAEIMTTNGASSEEVSSYRNDMNRLPVTHYRRLIPQIVDELGCTAVFSADWSGTVNPDFVHHENRFEAAQKLGLEADDLLVRGFHHVIKKG